MDGRFYSNQGGREYNEDSAVALVNREMFCGIVADGLGGHGGGDVASSTAMQIIQDHFMTFSGNAISKTDYTDWFHEANEQVLELQKNGTKMKTTLAVLALNDMTNVATWAHMGDSRIYHFIDGKVDFCTFDHSVSRMAVLSGEIELSQVRFHPDRNKLIKAIGKEDVGSPEYGECEMDMYHSHAFLVCSDGFWEYVTEEEMEAALANSAGDAGIWIQQMVTVLMNKVASSGVRNDNFSVVVFIK